MPPRLLRLLAAGAALTPTAAVQVSGARGSPALERVEADLAQAEQSEAYWQGYAESLESELHEVEKSDEMSKKFAHQMGSPANMATTFLSECLRMRDAVQAQGDQLGKAKEEWEGKLKLLKQDRDNLNATLTRELSSCLESASGLTAEARVLRDSDGALREEHQKLETEHMELYKKQIEMQKQQDMLLKQHEALRAEHEALKQKNKILEAKHGETQNATRDLVPKYVGLLKDEQACQAQLVQAQKESVASEEEERDRRVEATKRGKAASDEKWAAIVKNATGTRDTAAAKATYITRQIQDAMKRVESVMPTQKELELKLQQCKKTREVAEADLGQLKAKCKNHQ